MHWGLFPTILYSYSSEYRRDKGNKFHLMTQASYQSRIITTTTYLTAPCTKRPVQNSNLGFIVRQECTGLTANAEQQAPACPTVLYSLRSPVSPCSASTSLLDPFSSLAATPECRRVGSCIYTGCFLNLFTTVKVVTSNT